MCITLVETIHKAINMQYDDFLSCPNEVMSLVISKRSLISSVSARSSSVSTVSTLARNQAKVSQL